MNATVLEDTSIATGDDQPAAGSSSIYRLDRFECPVAQRDVFADRLAIIHGYFDTLPGCLYNRLMVAAGENEDMVKITTIVEWRDREALEDAKSEVAAFYRKSGFNPGAFMAEHGIQGEFGVYMPMEL